MSQWEYLVSLVDAEGDNAASEVLDKWRSNLKDLGQWADDEPGWELVAEHYSESMDGGRAVYRGTFKRPLT